MTPPIPTYTVPEVAAALRVCRKTVYRMVRRRQLRVLRIGRSVRILQSELARCLERLQRP